MRLMWKAGEWEALFASLGKFKSGHDALKAHNKKWKTARTLHALECKLNSYGKRNLGHLLAPPEAKEVDSEEARIQPLLDLLKRRSKVIFAEACDSLDLSPRRLMALVDLARARNHRIPIAGDRQTISLDREAPAPDRWSVHRLPIEPINDVIAFLATSDTHSGSLHARPECLKDAFEYAYHEHGVRRGLHSGDVTDGLHVYRGQHTELLHHTMGAQVNAAAADIPRAEGFTWDMIGGNHDEAFLKDNGADVMAALAQLRPDIRTHDYYQALMDIGPEEKPHALKVELFHPGGGIPYARSYPLQKAIEKIPGGMKPHILLAGHLHYEMTMCYRGIFGVQVPCFQDQSLLGKRMGAAPEIGCFIIKVGITRGCAIKTVNIERVQYFHSARGPVRCTVRDRDGNQEERRFERRVALD